MEFTIFNLEMSVIILIFRPNIIELATKSNKAIIFSKKSKAA
jgi:hypothetical protein